MCLVLVQPSRNALEVGVEVEPLHLIRHLLREREVDALVLVRDVQPL